MPSAAALLVAFAAGFVSFASPCVLPLVRVYLSSVSGTGFDRLGVQRGRVAAATAGFVLGFTVVFVLLGAGVAWFGAGLLQHRRTLEVIAGAFVIAAALVIAGVPLPRALIAQRRLHPRRGASTLVSAPLAGAAFAVGWTPCIGPTLAAILALSASAGHSSQGAILLAVYSLGLGVPFLAVGLAFTAGLSMVRAVRTHARAVARVSAAFLMIMGVLLMTGQFDRLSSQLAGFGGWQL